MDLDVSLLSGELAVDDYAKRILKKDDDEGRGGELLVSRAEFEELRKERDALQALLDRKTSAYAPPSAPGAMSSASDKREAASDEARPQKSLVHVYLERVRTLGAVNSEPTSVARLLGSVSLLASSASSFLRYHHLQRNALGINGVATSNEDVEEAMSVAAKEGAKWYLETFNDELSELMMMNKKQDGVIEDEGRRANPADSALLPVVEELKAQLKQQTAANEEMQRNNVQKLAALKRIAEDECDLRVRAHEILSEFIFKERARKYFMTWWREATVSRRKRRARNGDAGDSELEEEEEEEGDGGNAEVDASDAEAIARLIRGRRRTTRASGGVAINVAKLKSLASKQKVPALLLAASKGMSDAVIALIDDGSAVNMSARTTGQSPLHAAAAAGSADVAEILLEAGANVSALDDEGDSPLIYACKAGDVAYGAALALLRHGADPGAGGKKDARTPLHHAVESRATKIVEIIVRYDRRTVAAGIPETSVTPLHLAAGYGQFEAARYMVEAYFVGSGAMGGKMLSLSSAESSESISASALNTSNSTPHLLLDFRRRTPLHYACASDSPDASRVIQLLMESAACYSANDASLDGEETPLMAYAKNLKADPETITNVFARASNHVDFDLQDASGFTALHHACARDARALALALVRAGASLYLLDRADRCVLDLTPQAFAIELLSAVRVPPYISRCQRAHRGLRHCMLCKGELPKFRWGVNNCRRCGRLACPKCLVKGGNAPLLEGDSTVEVVKGLLNPKNLPTVAKAAVGTLVSGAVGEELASSSSNPTVMCLHCHQIVAGEDGGVKRVDVV